MSRSEKPGRALLESALGYRFEDGALLDTALRHSSWAHEHGAQSNERLEFLGDAVLGLVAAELLYESHPDWNEGDLTRARHQMVEGSVLSELARGMGVGDHLSLGSTEQAGHGAAKASILEDAMEAILGAMYLDGGVVSVEAWVRRVFAELLSTEAAPVRRDAKSEFQERVMARFGEFPTYEVVHDTEVETDDQRFTVAVCVLGDRWAFATDRSKRTAEKEAARLALRHPGLQED